MATRSYRWSIYLLNCIDGCRKAGECLEENTRPGSLKASYCNRVVKPKVSKRVKQAGSGRFNLLNTS